MKSYFKSNDDRPLFLGCCGCCNSKELSFHYAQLAFDKISNVKISKKDKICREKEFMSSGERLFEKAVNLKECELDIVAEVLPFLQ